MWFFSRKVQPSVSYPSFYKAAGCIFFTERHLLAGYQPNKGIPVVSGLGGTRKSVETAPDTAFRETIEELYNISSVPKELINRLEQKLIPKTILVQGDYVALVFTLKQLLKLLKLCKNFGIKSPLYVKMPLTFEDLLLKRLADPAAEISHLCLFPLVDVRNPAQILDKYFLSDIRRILHHSDLPVTS